MLGNGKRVFADWDKTKQGLLRIGPTAEFQRCGQPFCVIDPATCAHVLHLTPLEDVFMNDLSHLTRLMEHRGIARKTDLVGVGEREIQSLEAFWGLRFPEVYRQFLKEFGRSAGKLSPWLAIYFDDLKEIKEQFVGLIALQPAQLILPQDALLIAHWESVFDFIRCNGLEDPQVFRVDLYSAQRYKIRLYAHSVSDYLENLIETSETEILPGDFFAEQDILSPEDMLVYHH